jgi:hypothetical protein
MCDTLPQVETLKQGENAAEIFESCSATKFSEYSQ